MGRPKSKDPDKTVESANGNCAREPQTQTPESPGHLKRRDLLKVLSSLPAAALVPLRASPEATSPVEPKPGSAPEEKPGVSKGVYQPKVLNAHEWKTISLLSDLIIPADERSGSATQAGVPEFIDDWLGFKGGDLLAQVRGGLVWLDMECNRGFSRDFVDCTKVEQKQMLDRIAFPKRAAPEDAAGVGFFSILKRDGRERSTLPGKSDAFALGRLPLGRPDQGWIRRGRSRRLSVSRRRVEIISPPVFRLGFAQLFNPSSHTALRVLDYPLPSNEPRSLRYSKSARPCRCSPHGSEARGVRDR